MGGMKSGTGDVWGDDDESEDAAAETGDEVASETDDAESVASESMVEESAEGRETDVSTSGAGFPSGGESTSESEPTTTSRDDAGDDSDVEASESTSSEASGGGDESETPYVVRRMLKDRSVQYERDERLTLFVHDDVKAGEQELEAETQDLFGRDIPVFDIREAVYRAALRNRDDVVAELEEMGYTRD